MEINNSEESLKNKWCGFVKVIFDPWVLSLLSITSVFIYYSTEYDNKKIVALITLIVSLLSGILGGIIANKWTQLTELKVQVARGKTAIRSLKLILLNISNIEKRTKEYITRIDSSQKGHKLIISNFEEIIEKCNILEEEVISSIENWTDIIPEVENLKTQIGLVSEMKNKQAILEDEIISLKEKIETVKEEESKQKELLKIKLNSKEEELNKTSKKLAEKENKLNTSVLSGLTSKNISNIHNPMFVEYLHQNKCSKCGKPNNSPSSLYDTRCDDCRKINLTFGN